MENIVFQVVDAQGDVDETIHDEEKCGQSHMLTIKSDSFNSEDSIRYTFRHGCCTVPAIPVPSIEGSFCFIAAHSRYSELRLSIKVPVLRAPEVGTQSPCPDVKPLLPEESSPLKDAGNLMLSIVDNDKV